jgi:hypothetical protein
MRNDDDLAVPIFRFWRTIEALTPQKIERTNPNDKTNPSILLEGPSSVFPWDDSAHRRKPVARGKVWEYTLQCGIYSAANLAPASRAYLGSTTKFLTMGATTAKAACLI